MSEEKDETQNSKQNSQVKNEPAADEEEDEEEANDTIKFHKEGWKMRYYSEKFGVDEAVDEFVQDVAYHYCRGLSWVLQYYFRGCPSWKWFYQYHYAPFASDFSNIAKINNKFNTSTEPFKPFEQLMGVFPPASRKFLPKVYHPLMTDEVIAEGTFLESMK